MTSSRCKTFYEANFLASSLSGNKAFGKSGVDGGHLKLLFQLAGLSYMMFRKSGHPIKIYVDVSGVST